MTTLERTTPTQRRNVSARAIAVNPVAGAVSNDLGIRGELNDTTARRVIELPVGRPRKPVAAT